MAQKACNDDGGNLVCFATQEEREFWKDDCDKCWSGYNRIQGIKDMKNRIHTRAIMLKVVNEAFSSQFFHVQQVYGLLHQTVLQITSALMTLSVEAPIVSEIVQLFLRLHQVD